MAGGSDLERTGKRKSSHEHVHRCPACERAFQNLFDYPWVRLLTFETLPVPESVDTLSSAAAEKQIARRRQGRATDDGINMTPAIAQACSTPEVVEYLRHVSSLVGQVVKPQSLLPPIPPSTYFRRAYPVGDTGIFLALDEAESAAGDQQIADVQVYCEGPNMGSAGGATLQLVGSIARLSYEGLLSERFRRADVP